MTDLRAHVRSLIDADFDGNITHAAHAMGISHPYLSQYLNKRTGAGRKLTRGLSALTGKSLDEIDAMAAAERSPVPAEADPMRCEHPSEAPHVCPCRVGCYCKTRTCRPAEAKVWFGEVRHRLRSYRSTLVRRIDECNGALGSASEAGRFGEAAAIQARGRAYQLDLADFDRIFPEAKP